MMFYYCVDYWDLVENEPRQEAGLLANATYKDAAEKVIEFYGKENVTSVYLEEWDDPLVEDEAIDKLTDKKKGIN